MDPQQADLGDLIARIMYQGRRSSRDIFSGSERPRLERGQTNRILVYAGSFNPPHRGHKALLDLAFSHCRDINVVAAIILPLGDERLADKYGAQENTFMCRYDQRVRIWQETVGQDPYWVCDDLKNWDSFRHEFHAETNRAGFPIELVCLCGPDHFSVTSPPPWNCWSCTELVVSNVARSADFVINDEALQRLQGCTAWKRVAWSNRGRMTRLQALRMEAVRECHWERIPRYTVRFIRAPNPMDDICATQIRQLINDYIGENAPRKGLRERLEKALKPKVLQPKMLVDFIIQNERQLAST